MATHRSPRNSDTSARQDSVWSLAAFWIVAFIGVSLFAAVLIAPKWQVHQALRTRVRVQAAQCAYLSDCNEHMRRVIEAFKNDPEFNAEMARSSLGYVGVNEERIEAPIDALNRPKPPVIQPEPPDPIDPFVRLFAADPVVRQTALITAAVFIIFSIAFFNSKSAHANR